MLSFASALQKINVKLIKEMKRCKVLFLVTGLTSLIITAGLPCHLSLCFMSMAGGQGWGRGRCVTTLVKNVEGRLGPELFQRFLTAVTVMNFSPFPLYMRFHFQCSFTYLSLGNGRLLQPHKSNSIPLKLWNSQCVEEIGFEPVFPAVTQLGFMIFHEDPGLPRSTPKGCCMKQWWHWAMVDDDGDEPKVTKLTGK